MIINQGRRVRPPKDVGANTPLRRPTHVGDTMAIAYRGRWQASPRTHRDGAAGADQPAEADGGGVDVSEHFEVGFWCAGHGGHLTVEQNRAHDAACDGRGACTWRRCEEPHHAAAREATDDERKILSHLRERAVRAALRQEGPNGGSPSAVEPRSVPPRENGRTTLLDPTSAHREAR